MTLPSREQLEALAVEGGRIALGHFRRTAPERKADRSLVTAADREVEQYLAGELARLLPGAAILGEEGARSAGQGAFGVAIDPIDGTAAFVAGLPTWCVCVGILEGGEPVAGVVHLPVAGETYVAAGGRAWWNGTPLRPLGETTAGDRFILTDSKLHLRHRLRYSGKARCLGSSAYHVAIVARGAAEAAFVGRAHLWDLAASGALLAAVGGRYEYLSGAPVALGTLADGRRAAEDILAGTPAALAAVRLTIEPLA